MVGGMTLPPLVDAAWLSEHLDDVVVADVRWYLDDRSGRDAYDTGHIPGAVHVDVDTDLAAPPTRPGQGRHPLPTPDAFAATMASLGIGDGDTVVAYDDADGAMAARLVWMLRVTGHDAALLDGGIGAWEGPLETGAVSRSRSEFTAGSWPSGHLAGFDEVGQAAEDHGPVVIDARSAERYRGEAHPLDARAGHVPGARSLPFAGNVDPGTGRFLTPERLRERFAAVGVGEGTDVIAYCGSGVTACHDLLALEVAGLGPGRLVVGSWSAWTADPDRPAATGEKP
jgi:thiosulfate/3-mercaptopyruvate sulfurtransferase